MLTLQYPSVPYSPEYEIAALAPSARTRVAANGRGYVQHLTIYDDGQVTISHPWVSQADRDEILRFYDDARQQEFVWEDKQGDLWDARFLRRPAVRREANKYAWTLTVDLFVSRQDQP